MAPYFPTELTLPIPASKTDRAEVKWIVVASTVMERRHELGGAAWRLLHRQAIEPRGFKSGEPKQAAQLVTTRKFY